MISNKKTVERLVKICKLKGLKHVVFSPGSRNAPLVISFNSDAHFECLSITDERSAAFFAMGMAKQSRIPVIISCTSGTAALNYAPAIAEAYYQKIPLIILTADRAKEWVDQGDGQTIVQKDIYRNYIKASFEILQETNHEDELKHNDRIFNEAINISQAADAGPVHINFPFREPIYDTIEGSEARVKIIEEVPKLSVLGLNTINALKEIWNASEKKMLITGLLEYEDHLSEAINKCISIHGITALTEITSNLNLEKDIPTIDRVIDGFSETEQENYSPNLLITIGGAIVSKKIKKMLRKHRPKHHWHIGLGDSHPDTFQSLTQIIPIKAIVFFTELNKWKSKGSEKFLKQWQSKHKHIFKKHEIFTSDLKWSDLYAYKVLIEALPERAHIHMANSTSIRYMLLFEQKRNSHFYSNRGVSGIDGCTSSALGFSYLSEEKNILITGDLAFFYDSNAFWNKYIDSGLKIIIVNNSGGGIFRIISGPPSTDQLDDYFEAHQTRSAKGLAKTYTLPYDSANSEEELKDKIPSFLSAETDQCSILEIFTPRLDNDKVLKAYFESLMA